MYFDPNHPNNISIKRQVKSGYVTEGLPRVTKIFLIIVTWDVTKITETVV